MIKIDEKLPVRNVLNSSQLLANWRETYANQYKYITAWKKVLRSQLL
jgi:hypothetical protein